MDRQIHRGILKKSKIILYVSYTFVFLILGFFFNGAKEDSYNGYLLFIGLGIAASASTFPVILLTSANIYKHVSVKGISKERVSYTYNSFLTTMKEKKRQGRSAVRRKRGIS